MEWNEWGWSYEFHEEKKTSSFLKVFISSTGSCLKFEVSERPTLSELLLPLFECHDDEDESLI